jgi:hypothetical protein
MFGDPFGDLFPEPVHVQLYPYPGLAEVHAHPRLPAPRPLSCGIVAPTADVVEVAVPAPG